MAKKKALSPRAKRERAIIGSTVGVVAVLSGLLFVSGASNQNQDVRSQAHVSNQIEECNDLWSRDIFTDGAVDPNHVRMMADASHYEIDTQGLLIQSRGTESQKFQYADYKVRPKADFQAVVDVKNVNNAGSAPIAAILQARDDQGTNGQLAQVRLVKKADGSMYADMVSADRASDLREGTPRVQVPADAKNVRLRLTHRGEKARGFVDAGNGFQLIETMDVPGLAQERLTVRFGTRAFGDDARGAVRFNSMKLDRCGAKQ